MVSLDKENRCLVAFSYSAGKGHDVYVTGSFNDWELKRLAYASELKSYKVELQLPPGVYEYKFVVDGEWQEDKNNSEFVANDFGTISSILRVV